MARDKKFYHIRKSRLKREIKKQEYRDSFLIICEGEKTEPNYFSSFKVNIKVEILGLGRNTLSLVEEAINIWEKYAQRKERLFNLHPPYFNTLWVKYLII